MSDPFRTKTALYESWFESFEATYSAEVSALTSLRPETKRSLEVGVGTGRFAEPLEITHGIDPAPEMLQHAIDRGLKGVLGVGEQVPFEADSFGLVMLVTTVCFLDDRAAAFREAARVLQPDGRILLGFIDRESPLGRQYEENKDENPFYQSATFVTAEEIERELDAVGFSAFERRQTVFTEPEAMDEPDPVKRGTGDGSFVVISARP